MANASNDSSSFRFAIICSVLQLFVVFYKWTKADYKEVTDIFIEGGKDEEEKWQKHKKYQMKY